MIVIKLRWHVILGFVLLWILLYIEPLRVSTVKISQVWKIPILLAALLSLVPKKIPLYGWLFFLFGVKYFLNSSILSGIDEAAQDFLESLFFPVSILWFNAKLKSNEITRENVTYIGVALSIFFILSTVPFLFGLKTFNPVMDLESYGLNTSAVKGLFYHVATSSKLFVLSTIVLLLSYELFSSNFVAKLVWAVTVLLGLYFIYASWTRTGWLVFILGLFFSFIFKSSLKAKVYFGIVIVILCYTVVYLYNTSDAFKWRITGGATYRQETDLSIEQLSQARFPFIIQSISNLNDEGLMAWLIGYGTTHGKELFDKSIGLRITCHNKTFEIIESSGLVALAIYIFAIISLMSQILRTSGQLSNSEKRRLYTLLFIFFCFYLTSHGTPFWGEILIASFIAPAITKCKYE